MKTDSRIKDREGYMAFKERFVSNLCRIAEEKGFGKHWALAEAAGVSAAAVSCYMQGKMMPTVDTAVRLAEALEVSIDELVR